MKHLILITLLLSLIAPLRAQETIEVSSSCNLHAGVNATTITVATPSQKMLTYYNEIVKIAGQPPEQIRLGQSDMVSNAAAIISRGKRYITYSPAFLADFEERSLTSWSAKFLLAHEIGHHYLGHQLAGNTQTESHRNEFAADRFAAKILANLNADLNETIAGISTLVEFQNTNSQTHPQPDVRIDTITSAWKAEMELIVRQQRETATSNIFAKKPLKLNESAFKNRWNLLSDAKAEVDGEKAIFYYNVPSNMRVSDLKVCVLSADSEINPGRNSVTLFNSLTDRQRVTLGNSEQLIWSYRIDGYLQNQVTKQEQFSLFAFDRNNLPKAPAPSRSLSGGLLLGAGTAAMVVGVLEWSEGRNLYDNVYFLTREPADYEEADGKYFRGQVLMAAGAAGALWGLRIFNRARTQQQQYEQSSCGIHKENTFIDRAYVTTTRHGVTLGWRIGG